MATGCDTCDSCDGWFLCLVHVYVCTRVDEDIDLAVTAVTAVTNQVFFGCFSVAWKSVSSAHLQRIYSGLERRRWLKMEV